MWPHRPRMNPLSGESIPNGGDRMLKLHFINVADGDAILAEDLGGCKPFRLLVDTGQAQLEEAEGSLRLTAADYLRKQQITHIDALVVTHLHTDHFGGLELLMPEVAIDNVYSGFFPSNPGQTVPQEPDAQKTIRGMIECVNLWSQNVEKLKAAGCQLHTVSATIPALPLTDRLTADVICPNETVNAVQRLVWEDMLSGKEVPEDLKYWVSKLRNPGSLRLRLTYGGRSVELAGDCFGNVWDRENVQPCDILKVPHHGDCKALTQTLVRRLNPSYAVISCAAEYIPRKDRPSYETVELLRRQGARVWFTDSFGAEWYRANHWSCVEFEIHEDGTIITPDIRGCGRR